MKNVTLRILQKGVVEYEWVIIAALSLFLAFFAITAYAQTTPTPMSPGESSAQVRELQTFLAADTSVYPEGLITGYYGALTTAAVQRYQCKYSIVCQGTVATTGYGRVGPMTLAEMLRQGGFGGIATGSSDLSAPILSGITVATSPSTAAIHWLSSEPATSQVLFSTAPPQLSYESFAAMRTSADPTRDNSGNVVLSGLSPNTRYYYVLQSVDLSGNIQYDIENSFVTNP
ncbi:MAG: hypothetical protein RLZZ342_267 [Candidatus Parcubacteria bacterium]|jgi:peptidoglycan hydrolase-like protein with peptidoglycan-binding domain